MSQIDDFKPSQESGDIARLLSYVALLAASVGMFIEASTIPTSRFEALGAGAFPMLVHACLSLLLVAAIIGSLRKLPAVAYARFGTDAVAWVKARRLVLFLFACLALFVMGIPMIGYPVAAFVFLIVLQVTYAPKTRLTIAVAVVLALIFSFGLNWLFAEVFNVFLPRGL